MARCTALLVCLAVWCSRIVLAQTSGKDSSTAGHEFDDGDIQEELLGQMESEAKVTSLVDHLQLVEANPYDLNSVTAADLETLPGVTPGEASAVVAFRKLIRKFTSVRQVEVIEGIDSDLYKKIRKYVVVQEERIREGGKGQPVLTLRMRTLQDLQSRDITGYRGSTLKSYSRAHIAPSEDLNIGVLFEKDAGEKFSDGFVSGYIRADDVPGFSGVILGDYLLESGQGLVLWPHSAFGKGGDVIRAVRKSPSGIRANKSSDELAFLRGGAAASSLEIGHGNLEFVLGVSARNLPGSFDEVGMVTNLYEGGLFRTENEVRKKNQLKEQFFGGGIHFVSANGWSLGGSYAHASYSASFAGGGAFDFTGNATSVFGLDARVITGKLLLFGEAAQSRGGNRAGIAGGILELPGRVNAAFAYRDYTPGFYSPHGSGFGEYDRLRNERGYYLGVEAAPARWLQLKGYLDRFNTPWRTASNPLPSSGTDLLLQAEIKPVARLEVAARYSMKTIASTAAAVDERERELRMQVDRNQQRGRIHATYQVNTSLRIKGRIEATSVAYSITGKREQGTLVFQDVYYRSGTVTVQFRLIFFQTDSYDSRLYEFENDLSGISSIPALYGKGRRYYLLVGYTPVEGAAFSVKYAETQKEYTPATSGVSSGFSSEIDNRLSFQLEITL